MEDCLVGSTGFVGSNLMSSHTFSQAVHSTDVEEAYGSAPKLLVYAGMRAEKYLANRFPKEDKRLAEEALENMKKIQPQKLVLISTIDVYQDSKEKDEDSVMEKDASFAYGYHRQLLEEWVREEFDDVLILRLPALFGKNLKKNFLYDYCHVIPSMLTEDKFLELSEQEPVLRSYYEKQENGFYRCCPLSLKEKEEAKQAFLRIGFTAMNFTDSRAEYQFFPLADLWEWIVKLKDQDIPVFNLTSEPVSAAKIYEFLTGGKTFVNEISKEPVQYDLRTKYAGRFGGANGYLYEKMDILKRIKDFAEQEMAGESI